ncbi:hypothetical protein [Aeromonas salmonicida]
MLDLLKFAAGQHLGQAILELLDQLVADRVAEGEAELLRAALLPKSASKS